MNESARGSNDDPRSSTGDAHQQGRPALPLDRLADLEARCAAQRRAARVRDAPEEVYELAKRRGMDFVTITDHDTIDGVLEIADLPDVFISEELTVSFPGEPQAVHVLCFGITPDDHEWLQGHSGNVEECAEYLRGNEIACALAHPFYAVAAPLSPRHRRRLAELFGVWETRNGSRAHELNRPASIFADTQGLTGIGGSDDHAGVDIGRTFTSTPRAADAGRVRRAVATAPCEPGGEEGAPRSGPTPRSRSRPAACSARPPPRAPGPARCSVCSSGSSARAATGAEARTAATSRPRRPRPARGMARGGRLTAAPR